VLLLRSLVEGNYAEAMRFVLPVCGITLLCCLLSIRWAIYQFNQESVLFRESERLDLRRWVVRLVRDRQDTPSISEAFACVVLIFVTQFFMRLSIASRVPESPDFAYLSLILFISQVVCIALPALLMTLFLTNRPLRTLRLSKLPRLAVCMAALLLALFFHPIGQQLVIWISHLYPVQEGVLAESRAFVDMLKTAPYVWLPFLLIAVLPAICEEIAFRGFILSGLRRLGHKWWAIGLSAVFFGMAHTVFQQSLAAAAVGLVLGYLVVQTGSLITGMIFHMTYNGLMLASSQLPQILVADGLLERYPTLRLAFKEVEEGQVLYSLPLVALCGLFSIGILAWLHRLPYQATAEEQLHEVRALGATIVSVVGHDESTTGTVSPPK